MGSKSVVIPDRNNLWRKTAVKEKPRPKLLPLSHISSTLKAQHREESPLRKPLGSRNVNVSLIIDSSRIQKPPKKVSRCSASLLGEVLSSSSLVRQNGRQRETRSGINVILKDSHFQQSRPSGKASFDDYRQKQLSVHAISPSNSSSQSLVGGLQRALYNLRTLIKVVENSCEGSRFDILLSVGTWKQLSENETLIIPDSTSPVDGDHGGYGERAYVLHHPNLQPFQKFTRRNMSDVRIAINSELTFKLTGKTLWVPYWKIAQV